MKTKLTVRYLSGREEQFEVDVYGGEGAETRLQEFVNNPTLVLQTEKEVVIIPATAIESITFPLPESAGTAIPLRNVRKAKRLK
jgi:hypothetical protein